MNQQISHIVFDCDGTLVSSHNAIIIGLRDLIHEISGENYSIEYVKERYSTKLGTVFHNFGLKDVNPENAKRWLERWYEINQSQEIQMPLYAGMIELLKELKRQKHELYVWTARDRASTITILKQNKILDFFTDIRCANDTVYPKPNPAGLKELIENHSKEKAIMIGDSYSDVEGANLYGIPAIGAMWCERANAEELKSIGAKYLAFTPQECLNIIDKHFSR